MYKRAFGLSRMVPISGMGIIRESPVLIRNEDYIRRTPSLHMQRLRRNIRPVMHSLKLNLFHHRIRLLSRFP
jgi:hypothetical protein